METQGHNCSICAGLWGVGNDEDYKDPSTNELVCNHCALEHEGTDYYETTRHKTGETK